MFKQIALCLLCCASFATIHAYEDRDLLQRQAGRDRLKTMLLQNQEWVTYPKYQDRAGWEAFLGSYRDDLIKQGEKRLDYQWQVVKATDYLEFERSGDRNVMSGPYGANTGAISDLFWAEMAEGKGRFMDQLANGLYALCEMTSWSASAHQVAQRSHRALPDHRDTVIDLNSGNTALMVAWIHYFLHEQLDKIDPSIAERMRYEIDRKILTPYLEETRYWWLATNFNAKSGGYVNNWNPWCNSSVLQCFLLMEKEPDRMVDGVYKSMVSVDKFINFAKEDGACEEGPSYWTHAAGKLYDYLTLLQRATNGKIDIFNTPMIRNMGEYIARSYVGDGWVVNFADAAPRENPDHRLVYRFGKAVDSSVMMNFAAYLSKQQSRKGGIKGGDTFRTFENFVCDREIDGRDPVLKHPPYSWYPETQFCYITNDRAFLAAKGGHNNESHNHNDVGTFSLFIDNKPFFIDAGVGTYTRQTFSSGRYTIWTMQSDYHNVPNINGAAQKNGRSFRASGASFDPAKNRFSLDIANAYPQEAGIREWTREYTLEKDRIDITDSFRIDDPKQPNKLRFMTWGKPDVSDPGKVVVTVDGTTATLLYDKDEFTASDETIEMTDRRLSRPWGKALYRVTLTAKQLEKDGRYKVEIKY